ncbi:transporter substrate-binding domain-containing protein [Pseudomonas sp. 6D_7.1_Bac1]|uniref:transporter substrate-binding domain-containing protein n=1 Tax=Pseudomonas sp. 6D_7.1_Bac1 TaxID=2971615 RepID=UPI0021CA6975|nr:transporter substrate-binding domain-containing protein [Pseudomonas sp. 6D_7.1_Bac1]MCU1750809.1 transporter substrate-binding domain-containing protein [Pseudomonas sp. 6D_7.1_Bac1]
MWFFTGLKPALCRVFLLSAMGLGHCVWAAQLDALDIRAAITNEPLKLEAQELEWIAEHRRVVVASVQFPLYLFKDEHGQWSGLNNDILQRLSRMTGLEFVHEESFSTEHLLGLLESGRADMSTTLAVNEERKGFLDFSHAFGGAGWVFVGRAGVAAVDSLEDLAGKVLALPARHALEAGIRRDHPQIELRSVKTYAEARALVESGEAYVTIENEMGAHLYPAGPLAISSSIEGLWEADHLALRKEQPQLLSIINKALEAFPPAELRAIRSKWLSGVVPTQPPSLWQRIYQWGCWGVFFASLFGLISLLWNQRLNRQIERRLTAEQRLGDQLVFQHTLMNAMPDPVFVRDQEGRLILCNKSYEEHLSTRFDQMKGKRLTEVDVLPASTAELLHAEIMEQLSSRKALFTERQLTFNSGVRDVYQWAVPFYSAEGLLRGVVGGWTDTHGRQRHKPDQRNSDERGPAQGLT